MKNKQFGGSLSSDLVLKNVEANAFKLLDRYFDNELPIVKGGGQKCKTCMQFQDQFKMILKGGNCDDNQNVPLNTFTPPFTKPEETTNYFIDSNLHDLHIEEYNQNLYSIL